MKSIDLKPTASGCLAAERTAASNTLAARLQSGITDWYQGWQKRRQYRQDLNHVAQFSNYLLRDIGLTSADVADLQRSTPFASTDRVGRPG